MPQIKNVISGCQETSILLKYDYRGVIFSVLDPKEEENEKVTIEKQ